MLIVYYSLMTVVKDNYEKNVLKILVAQQRALDFSTANNRKPLEAFEERVIWKGGLFQLY